MSDRQLRVLQILEDPQNREVTQLSRGDCAAIARCLAERDELLSRVETDAKMFRSLATLFRELGGTDLASDLDGYATDIDHIIARANKGVAL